MLMWDRKHLTILLLWTLIWQYGCWDSVSVYPGHPSAPLMTTAAPHLYNPLITLSDPTTLDTIMRRSWIEIWQNKFDLPSKQRTSILNKYIFAGNSVFYLMPSKMKDLWLLFSIAHCSILCIDTDPSYCLRFKDHFVSDNFFANNEDLSVENNKYWEDTNNSCLIISK